MIDPRIDKYAERATSPHEPLLAAVTAASVAELGATTMLTDAVAARLLELLVWFGRPRRVLEIGTYTGHSALAMASALPPDGRLDTCEVDPARAAFAQRQFDGSPYASQITLHVGPALETIGRLEGAFDFVFIDADKTGYIGNYEAVLPRLSDRGLIAVDNTLASGRVLDGSASVVAFNDHVAADPRSRQVLLTVRDGITLIRRA